MAVPQDDREHIVNKKKRGSATACTCRPILYVAYAVYVTGSTTESICGTVAVPQDRTKSVLTWQCYSVVLHVAVWILKTFLGLYPYARSPLGSGPHPLDIYSVPRSEEIGRASCRERVCMLV